MPAHVYFLAWQRFAWTPAQVDQVPSWLLAHLFGAEPDEATA